MSTTIIMMGNPGSGKSTLLSGLVEGNTFASGPSIGSGKTTVIQRVVHKGTNYIDTPGLSDVKLREHAAAAIESAFNEGGTFKVFFVVTLESGRVKPDDIATIKLVLDSLPQIKHNEYSIIVNKVSKEVRVLLESEAGNVELVSCLVPPSMRARTRSITIVPIIPCLSDQTNKWVPPSPELFSFISNAPKINIPSASILPIQHSQFEKILKELHAEIQQLREDNAALRRAMEDKEKLKWNENQQLREDNAALRQAIMDQEKLQRAEIQRLREDNAALRQEIINQEKLKQAEIQQLRSENAALRQTKEAVVLNPMASASNRALKPNSNSIIFIGNTGTGKSTLLSSLTKGKVQFISGISTGKGKTKILQIGEHDNITYIDTPGLSNTKLRKKGAREIESALKLGGKFKVFFIVTLEAGRVKPDDVTTIKLVLESATQIKDQYSIIINKMSKEVEGALRDSEAHREALAASLVPPSLVHRTRYIFYNPLNPAWTDKPNVIGDLNPELLEFIGNAPQIEITQEQVKAIQVEGFERLVAQLSGEVQKLKEDNAELRKAVEENKKKGPLKWYPPPPPIFFSAAYFLLVLSCRIYHEYITLI